MLKQSPVHPAVDLYSLGVPSRLMTTLIHCEDINPTSSLSIPLIAHQDGQFSRSHCNLSGSLCVPFCGLARELKESIESILCDSGDCETLARSEWPLHVSPPLAQPRRPSAYKHI